jgi:hypothetical protein
MHSLHSLLALSDTTVIGIDTGGKLQQTDLLQIEASGMSEVETSCGDISLSEDMRSKAKDLVSIIGHIDMIMESVIVIGPTLRNPYPWDLDEVSTSTDTSETALQNHTDRAKRMFPRASPVLVERLGKARFRRSVPLRRVHKAALQENRAREARKERKITSNQGPREIGMEVFQFQKPRLGTVNTPKDAIVPVRLGGTKHYDENSVVF